MESGAVEVSLAFEAFGREPKGLVLSCEHASPDVPEGLELGAPAWLLRTHRGFDLGAAVLARKLLEELGGELVSSRVCRLVVDVNRPPDHEECIPEAMDGIRLSGNLLDAVTRARRLQSYHAPYHAAIDRALVATLARTGGRALLFSVHSFTPWLHGRPRTVEAGILFDRHLALADLALAELRRQGLDARANQPYSGHLGMIYSVQRHGRRHDVPYLELEVRNDLLAPEARDGTLRRLLPAIRRVMEEVL